MSMHVHDEEKTGRKAALAKLMEVMSGETHKKLAGLKGKPVAASIEVEGPGEVPDDDDAGGFCPHCGASK